MTLNTFNACILWLDARLPDLPKEKFVLTVSGIESQYVEVRVRHENRSLYFARASNRSFHMAKLRHSHLLPQREGQEHSEPIVIFPRTAMSINQVASKHLRVNESTIQSIAPSSDFHELCAARACSRSTLSWESAHLPIPHSTVLVPRIVD